MRKYFVGVITSSVNLLVAGWLMAAPFVLQGVQPQGQSWTTATNWSFYGGLGLAVIAVLGLLGHSRGIADQLAAAGVRRAPRHQAQPEGRSAPAPSPAAPAEPVAAPQTSLDEQLKTQRELMSLLKELVDEERGAVRS